MSQQPEPSTAFYKVEHIPAEVAAAFDEAVAQASAEAVARGEREVSRTAAFVALLRAVDLRDVCVAGQGLAAGRSPALPVVGWGFHVPQDLKARISEVARALSVKSSAVGRLVLIARAGRFPESIEQALAAERTEEAAAARVTA